MNPAMIMAGVQIGQSLISGLGSSKASKDAAKAAERIGKRNYRELMRQADTEQDLGTQGIINTLEQQARHKGTVEAMYAKSGNLLTGTPRQTMREMQADFDFNIDQESESVAERVRRIRFQAKMAKMGAETKSSAYKEQAKGDLLASLFGAGKGGVQMFSAMGGGKNDLPKPGDTPSRTDPMYNLNLLAGFNR